MPSQEVHCRSCEEFYGEGFSEVHRWMDEPVEELGPGHQVERQDIEGTPEEVGEIFGEGAEVAARDHILLDKRWGEVPRIGKRKIRLPRSNTFVR